MRIVSGEVIFDPLLAAYTDDPRSISYGSDLNYLTIRDDGYTCQLISSCEGSIDAAIFTIEDLKELREGIDKLIAKYTSTELL